MFTLGCDKCLFSGKLPQDQLTLPVSWGSFWKVRQDGALDWYHHHHHYTAEPQLSVPSWKHTGVYILGRWHHGTPVPCFSQTGTLGCSPVACISKLFYPLWFIAASDGWTLEQHISKGVMATVWPQDGDKRVFSKVCVSKISLLWFKRKPIFARKVKGCKNEGKAQFPDLVPRVLAPSACRELLRWSEMPRKRASVAGRTCR